jgi:hypothetical protein
VPNNESNLKHPATINEILRDPRVLEPFLPPVLMLLTAIALITLVVSSLICRWDVASSLLIGLIAAGVIWWQGSLIKRQIAFSTYIEFDKEWNSRDMIETRIKVRDSQDRWDDSSLEGVLEFFEKLASFRLKGVLDSELIFDSTLGWYAARYWFFSREEVKRLRGVWKDQVYGDLERLYDEYLTLEVGNDNAKREAWETNCKETEGTFWEHERMD